MLENIHDEGFELLANKSSFALERFSRRLPMFEPKATPKGKSLLVAFNLDQEHPAYRIDQVICHEPI